MTTAAASLMRLRSADAQFSRCADAVESRNMAALKALLSVMVVSWLVARAHTLDVDDYFPTPGEFEVKSLSSN